MARRGDWDVIVVGARCAGSPLAMLLARKGYRVLLVDRAIFPSDTISSHLVFQTGLACLQRWGLLDRLAATGCPRIPSTSLDIAGMAIEGGWIPVDGIDYAFGPRRFLLDALLVEAAAEAGAQVRQGFSVRGLLFDGDRVVGIRGGGENGSEVAERASLVIGADGKFSMVARAAGAAKTRDEGSLLLNYYSYWSGVPVGVSKLFAYVGWGGGIFDTHNGLSLITLVMPKERLSEFRGNIDRAFRAAISQNPEYAEILSRGTREEPYRGMVDLPNFFRRSHGPGWALVGDAGYDKDPVSAQGISDAFRDADALATAIDEGLSGSGLLDDALAGYEAHRDEVSTPAFDWTILSTSFAPDPSFEQMTRLLRTVSADPKLSRDFVNLNTGVTRFDDLLAVAPARSDS